MSWTIDISSEQESQPPQDASQDLSYAQKDTNQHANKVSIPSAKKIRKATLEGIRIGILPEYQDYGVVLQYLVNQFVKHNYKFKKVQANVPWLNAWLVNPFNAQLLSEELELSARLEASRIQRHIMFMLEGGICTKTLGRLCGCLCCCFPCLYIACRVLTYLTDLCLNCCWKTLCDWWLGAFCRRFILAYLCYVPKYIKMKLEDLVAGDSIFEDEELSIRNVYDSNSYKVANQYACILLLSILLTVLGSCIVAVTYIYLPKHPDQLFMKAEAVLGILILTSGCFGMQFYCRCSL